MNPIESLHRTINDSHDLLDPTTCASNRFSTPLPDRIQRVLRCLKANQEEAANWLKRLENVRNIFAQILPVPFRQHPIEKQAQQIVDRLKLVQKEVDHVRALNRRQAENIRTARQALGTAFQDGGYQTLGENVAELVKNFKAVQTARTETEARSENQARTIEGAFYALQRTEERLMEKLGVTVSFSGTVGERITSIANSILLAIDANQCFAKGQSAIPSDERTQLENQIATLRAENNNHVEHRARLNNLLGENTRKLGQVEDAFKRLDEENRGLRLRQQHGLGASVSDLRQQVEIITAEKAEFKASYERERANRVTAENKIRNLLDYSHYVKSVRDAHSFLTAFKVPLSGGNVTDRIRCLVDSIFHALTAIRNDSAKETIIQAAGGNPITAVGLLVERSNRQGDALLQNVADFVNKRV